MIEISMVNSITRCFHVTGAAKGRRHPVTEDQRAVGAL